DLEARVARVEVAMRLGRRGAEVRVPGLRPEVRPPAAGTRERALAAGHAPDVRNRPAGRRGNLELRRERLPEPDCGLVDLRPRVEAAPELRRDLLVLRGEGDLGD